MEEGHRQGTAAKDVSSLGLSLPLLSSITADTEPQPQPSHQDQQVLSPCTCFRWLLHPC